MFDSNGNFLRGFGEKGSGDGQFLHPHGIAIDSQDNVYVLYEKKLNIQKFDSNGTFIKKFGEPGKAPHLFSKKLDDVAVDSDDNIYVVDFGNYKILKFDKEGNWIASIGEKGKGEGQLLRPWEWL